MFCSWRCRSYFKAVLLSCDLADRRRQRYSYRLKDLAAVPLALGADGKALTALFKW